MGDRIDPRFGVLLVDQRLSPTTEQSQGAGTFDSLYTEQGPKPGRPVPADNRSNWRPAIQGAQSVNLQVRTIRGGTAGRVAVGGAALAYQPISGSNTDLRGWNDPNLPVRWSTPAAGWGAAADWASFTMAVHPRTHVVMVIARPTSGGASRTFTYDPRTETWTARYNWNGGPNLLPPHGLAYDEEEDAWILMSGSGASGDPDTLAFRSTDNGDTWEVYARGMYSATISGGLAHVVTRRGADWLAFINGQQYASSDRGITWDQVEAAPAGSFHKPIRRAAGGYIVAYLNGTNDVCVRILPTARTTFASAAEIVVDSTDAGRVTGCVDYDGALYLYARGHPTPATRDEVRCYKSNDDGASWGKYTFGVVQGADAVYPEWDDCVAAAGMTHLLGTNVGQADTAGTFHLLSCGGWSTVEMNSGATDEYRNSRQRGSWGAYTGAGAVTAGLGWLPYHFPESMGWTRTVAAGTRSLNTASGNEGMSVVTTATNGEIFESTPGGSRDYASVEFYAKVDGASMTLAQISNSGPRVRLDLGNGVYHYRVDVYLGDDGIRVTSSGGASTDVTSIVTTTWTHYRVILRKGGVTVWYRTDGGANGVTAWSRVINDQAATDLGAGVATDRMSFGHVADATNGATTYWRMVGWAAGVDWRFGTSLVTQAGATAVSGVLGLTWGKLVPPLSSGGYPVPDATSTSEDVGRLGATGGPTYFSETALLPITHDYGFENVYPALAPSPKRKWKATADDTVNAVWDQGANAESWYGGAIGIAVVNSTLREVDIQLDNGGAGWSAATTMSMAVGTGLNFTRTGRTLIPRAGGNTIARYLHEGELVGGWVSISTAGSAVARRITRQSAGFWTDSATVQQVRLEVEGIDGTEHTTTATGEIYAHSALMVVYATEEYRRRLRVVLREIDRPGLLPEVGTLAVGRIVGIGLPPGWDWTRQLQLARRVTRAADQTPTVRQTGPPRELWSLGWPGGVFLEELRTLAASPNFVRAAAGGGVIGSEHDAWSMWGHIRHAFESGAVPSCVIPMLPGVTGTVLTDPTSWRYGVLMSETVNAVGVMGSEGTNEVIRLDGLTFEELAA